MPAIIVRGENSYRFSQLFQPFRDLLLLLLPRPFPRFRTMCWEHFARLPALLHELDEVIAAEILRRIFAAWPSAEGETFQAALVQVIVPDARDGPIVQPNKRHRA